MKIINLCGSASKLLSINEIVPRGKYTDYSQLPLPDVIRAAVDESIKLNAGIGIPEIQFRARGINPADITKAGLEMISAFDSTHTCRGIKNTYICRNIKGNERVYIKYIVPDYPFTFGGIFRNTPVSRARVLVIWGGKFRCYFGKYGYVHITSNKKYLDEVLELHIKEYEKTHPHN